MLEFFAKSSKELIDDYFFNNRNSKIIIVLKFEITQDGYAVIKEILKNKTFWKHKSFDLVSDYTEEQLIKDIKKVEIELTK